MCVKSYKYAPKDASSMKVPENQLEKRDLISRGHGECVSNLHQLDLECILPTGAFFACQRPKNTSRAAPGVETIRKERKQFEEMSGVT